MMDSQITTDLLTIAPPHHAAGEKVILPTLVHAPRRNRKTVDHTYRDYSVIDETMLASIQGESEESESDQIQKIKSALTELVGHSITGKHLGGVTKIFPEKVSWSQKATAKLR